MSTPKISVSHKNLIRRYLIWAYKSTRESFDRLERKQTQLLADDRILAELLKIKDIPAGAAEDYAEEVKAFREYIDAKRGRPVPQGKHVYVRHRLGAVEKTIVHFLGSRELGAIKKAYEQEFTRRIWESTDH